MAREAVLVVGPAHGRVFVDSGEHAIASASAKLTASHTPPALDAAPQHASAPQAEWWVELIG
jgi:hypothetical protein